MNHNYYSYYFFFFSSRRRHTRYIGDWSSDVCSSDLDSNGYIYDEEGIDRQKLDFILDCKNNRRGRISEYAEKFKSAVYTPLMPDAEFNPLWDHKADCAFPSATQNEINARDAKNLLKNGVFVVSEGSTMPTTIG